MTMTNAKEEGVPSSADVAAEQQNGEENRRHLHSLTVDTTHVAEEKEKGTLDKNSGPLLTPATYQSEEDEDLSGMYHTNIVVMCRSKRSFYTLE